MSIICTLQNLKESLLMQDYSRMYQSNELINFNEIYIYMHDRSK